MNQQKQGEQQGDGVRLQKYLATAGLASRREVEEWITQGRLTLNGKVAQLGDKITSSKDHIKLDGRLLHGLKKPAAVTLLMHKPTGVICSHADPYHSRTVFNLLPEKWQSQKFLCAGRLDKDSRGMLILSTDGELVHRLTHPSNTVVKRYKVLLNRPLQTESIPKLLQGITLEGERLKLDKVVPLGAGEHGHKSLEVHLCHGRKREIRRLLEAFGYFTEDLKRFQIGGLEMKGMPPGSVKLLNQAQIDLLFAGAPRRQLPQVRSQQELERLLSN